MVIVIANKDISWSVRDREILIQVSQRYYQLVLQITLQVALASLKSFITFRN